MAAWYMQKSVCLASVIMAPLDRARPTRRFSLASKGMQTNAAAVTATPISANRRLVVLVEMQAGIEEHIGSESKQAIAGDLQAYALGVMTSLMSISCDMRPHTASAESSSITLSHPNPVSEILPVRAALQRASVASVMPQQTFRIPKILPYLAAEVRRVISKATASIRAPHR